MSEIPNPEELDTRPVRMFAVLVDNEYAGVIAFPESEYMTPILAGLDSNPTILPVTHEQIAGVTVGYIWNGSQFSQPE